MAPSKRRRTSGPATTSANSQSTLSFRGTAARVTKPTTTTLNAKSTQKDLDTVEKNPIAVSIHPNDLESASEHELDPKAAGTAAVKSAELDDELAVAKPSKSSTPKSKTKKPPALSPHESLSKTAMALPASKITAYWRAKEAARTAPRVHQGHLSLQEKILREFDLTSRYGPCVGIEREARWWRAHGMGMKPDLEILTVLLKEKDGKLECRRSVVDRLMEGGKDA